MSDLDTMSNLRTGKNAQKNNRPDTELLAGYPTKTVYKKGAM